MFRLLADKVKLSVQDRETMTSGSVNVYYVKFEFSQDWNGLEKIAVFKADKQIMSVVLDESNVCAIPWELLTAKGLTIYAGVYGRSGNDVVMPTIWVSLGTVLEGVVIGEEPRPPDPVDLWMQELSKRGNRLDYTEEGLLGLYSDLNLLSSVQIESGGEGITVRPLTISEMEAILT